MTLTPLNPAMLATNGEWSNVGAVDLRHTRICKSVPYKNKWRGKLQIGRQKWIISLACFETEQGADDCAKRKLDELKG